MGRSGFYRGTVVSNADPDGLSRVRADVPQIIGMSVMGWCLPMMGSVNGIPAVGEQIWVAFEAGDVNFPLYIRGNTLSVDSLSSGAVTDGTALDTRTPLPPQNLVVTSDAYLDATGVLQGRVAAVWDAVTSAVDGTAINIGGYEVWGRPTDLPADAGTWAQVTAAEASLETGGVYAPVVVSWAPVGVGSAWQFMVRARAAFSPTLGLFSLSKSHTVSSLVDPPGWPSSPTLSSAIGVVSAAWDGLNAATIPMPGNFARVEVALGTTATPTTVYGALTVAGTIQGAFNLASGTLIYARMRSVDVFGTASDWTTAVSVQLLTVYDDATIQSQVKGPLDKINGAVIITQTPTPSVTVTNGVGAAVVVAPGAVTISDGAMIPTQVVITPGTLNFYAPDANTGASVRAAYIDGTVPGGLMSINAARIGHHIFHPYNTGGVDYTVVRWNG
jgi:hypothetical protein